MKHKIAIVIPEYFKKRADDGTNGMVSKYENVQKCCPDALFTDDLDVASQSVIRIIDPHFLWLYNNSNTDDFDAEKLTHLNQRQGLNLLWCEEQQILRWPRGRRREILNSMHAILACNAYQAKLLKPFAEGVRIETLYTPIDDGIYVPREKQRQIVAVGKLGIQKNSEAILHVFKQLPSDIRKVYLGSDKLWGEGSTSPYDAKLNAEMKAVCDVHIELASAEQVAFWVGESLIYLNMSIYDVGCLSFLEAAMAGCWSYCWNYHQMFNEYLNVTRFDTCEHALTLIREHLAIGPFDANSALRQEMLHIHGYEAFRTSLREVIANALLPTKEVAETLSVGHERSAIEEVSQNV